LVSVTACIPTGGPPEGSLRGSHGGQTIDHALDEDSLYWVQRRTSCATQNQDIFALHYGAGALEIYFQLDGGSTILGDRTFEYPQTAGSNLVWFSVSPGNPTLATATVTARISGLLARRTGEVSMTFSDGGTLDAEYSMPYDVKGERTSCGDGFDAPDD
jgi:hypothetical protein